MEQLHVCVHYNVSDITPEMTMLWMDNITTAPEDSGIILFPLVRGFHNQIVDTFEHDVVEAVGDRCVTIVDNHEPSADRGAFISDHALQTRRQFIDLEMPIDTTQTSIHVYGAYQHASVPLAGLQLRNAWSFPPRLLCIQIVQFEVNLKIGH